MQCKCGGELEKKSNQTLTWFECKRCEGIYQLGDPWLIEAKTVNLYTGPCREVPGESCQEDCDIAECPHWIRRPLIDVVRQ